MSATLPVPTILTVAKICEYLASENIPYTKAFRGSALDPRIAKMIYMERKAVQNRYDLNPSDTSLIKTSNYLFAILGRFQITGQNILASVSVSAPEITGPTNQTVAQGTNATFTVSVVSSLPVTYQWYRNGVAIPGATSISYTLTNAQPGDDGALFSVVATNAAGSTASVQATLTVTSTITGFFHYGSVDPGPALLANTDPFTYQVSFGITHNAPITVILPGGSTPNMFNIVKVPSTESAKNAWFNTPSNSGTIPDAVYQIPITFGGFTYYYTRVAASLDTNQTLVLSATPPTPPPTQDGNANYLFMLFDPPYVWDGVGGHAAIDTSDHTGLFFVYKNTATNWHYSRLRISDSTLVNPDYVGAWKDTVAGVLVAQYVGDDIPSFLSYDTINYDVSYDGVNYFTVEQQALVFSEPATEAVIFGVLDGTFTPPNAGILGWTVAFGSAGEFNTSVKGSYLTDFWTINNAQSVAYTIATGTLIPTLAVGTITVDSPGLSNHLFSASPVINIHATGWVHNPGDVLVFNYDWSINNTNQIGAALGAAYGTAGMMIFPVGIQSS